MLRDNLYPNDLVQVKSSILQLLFLTDIAFTCNLANTLTSFFIQQPLRMSFWMGSYQVTILILSRHVTIFVFGCPNEVSDVPKFSKTFRIVTLYDLKWQHYFYWYPHMTQKAPYTYSGIYCLITNGLVTLQVYTLLGVCNSTCPKVFVVTEIPQQIMDGLSWFCNCEISAFGFVFFLNVYKVLIVCSCYKVIPVVPH